eukprot:m.299454 g.299454  ORF g.299454 m.299454 type:complete len:724 (-) comp16414_c1_seq1:189-2360(-)
MAAKKFSNMLASLDLGHIVLKNRVLMGSMHTGLEDQKSLSAMGEYFAERARGGVGIMVTGGIAPNVQGAVAPFAAKMSTRKEMERHKDVTGPVRDAGGVIAMQILHSGRYAYHPLAVAPTKKKAPIAWFTPSELSNRAIESTIDDFVKTAVLAREAGYHGVEIMGSEGYLINEFLAKETNKRTDQWGGSYDNRTRLATEIVSRTRQAVGNDFIIIFRLSMLDLVPGGSEWSEIVELAQKIETAGASIINTGIGWHEARVPTIATCVPRAGFAWVTKKLKGEVSIPLCATNRINTPQVADEVLADGCADLVSMARPFLADPHFVNKAAEGRDHEINTCIGCNQACLDHTFAYKRASCLVNPLACYESELKITPVAAGRKMKVAVVGGGPAGLACATTCAERGHDVTLFEASDEIGGQFNMAKKIPGKEEFYETIRYFTHRLASTGVSVRLNTEVSSTELMEAMPNAVVMATGVLPREIDLPVLQDGPSVPKVYSYIDILRGKATAGKRVAIIGAGGIGFDVAEYLTHSTHTEEGKGPDLNAFLDEWGIDGEYKQRGGLAKDGPKDITPPRQVVLLQRKHGKAGATLGKTTGWIHRAQLKKRNVKTYSGVEKYLGIDNEGLRVTLKSADGKLVEDNMLIPCDTVVVCAGQLPLRELEEPVKELGLPMKFFRIGGAEKAGELDAKVAIDQGVRLAAQIEDAQSGQVFNTPPSEGEKYMKMFTKFLR